MNYKPEPVSTKERASYFGIGTIPGDNLMITGAVKGWPELVGFGGVIAFLGGAATAFGPEAIYRVKQSIKKIKL